MTDASGSRTQRDDYSHLVGHQFPGGRTTVPAWMNQLWGDAVASTDDPAPNVHPVLVYYAAIQGSGLNFQMIFDLMDAPADSGVMFGEQRFEFHKPLQVAHEYQVEGSIIEVVRKHGRRAGTFDILTFELRLSEPDAQRPHAISTTSFVFPRREVKP